MQVSQLIFIGIILCLAAHVAGCYVEQLARVQTELGDLQSRLGKLEAQKMRSEVRWGWLHRIASHVPVVKGLLS